MGLTSLAVSAIVQHADFLDLSYDKEADARHIRVNSSCPWNFVSQILCGDYMYVGWGTGIAKENIFCSYVYFAVNRHVNTGI